MTDTPDIQTICDKLVPIFKALDAKVYITPETRLMDDLDFDSLDSVQIALGCEREFGIDLDDDAIESWRTVGDVVQSVVEKLKP